MGLSVLHILLKYVAWRARCWLPNMKMTSSIPLPTPSFKDCTRPQQIGPISSWMTYLSLNLAVGTLGSVCVRTLLYSLAPTTPPFSSPPLPGRLQCSSDKWHNCSLSRRQLLHPPESHTYLIDHVPCPSPPVRLVYVDPGGTGGWPQPLTASEARPRPESVARPRRGQARARAHLGRGGLSIVVVRPASPTAAAGRQDDGPRPILNDELQPRGSSLSSLTGAEISRCPPDFALLHTNSAPLPCRRCCCCCSSVRVSSRYESAAWEADGPTFTWFCFSM